MSTFLPIVWLSLLVWHALCASLLFWLQRRLPPGRPVAYLVAGLLIWTNAGYALVYALALALAVRGRHAT